MSEHDNLRGYVIVRQDWYEHPAATDRLTRLAKISSLDPQPFLASDGVELVKHCYEVLAVPDTAPFGFTIGECRPVGEPHYDTLEEAQDYLREHGIGHPRLGFNELPPH